MEDGDASLEDAGPLLLLCVWWLLRKMSMRRRRLGSLGCGCAAAGVTAVAAAVGVPGARAKGSKGESRGVPAALVGVLPLDTPAGRLGKL